MYRTRQTQPAVILVDETSGCLDLYDGVDKYALPRTHFNIQRFGSPDDQGFRLLRLVLQEMVIEGPAGALAPAMRREYTTAKPSLPANSQPAAFHRRGSSIIPTNSRFHHPSLHSAFAAVFGKPSGHG